MTKEQNNIFYDLSMRLEPENLYEDGELTQEEAQEKAEELMVQWRDLEKECCEKVSYEDAQLLERL